MKLAPQAITLEALKAKQFLAQFPKLYALEGVVENSPAHDQQIVLEHTFEVLASLEQLLRLDFVKDAQLKNKLAQYLGHAPDILSRSSLIFLATAFHDIGKLETVITKAEGIIACPGHEVVSAGIAREYLEQIELSTREKIWILQFITVHGFLHNLIDVYLKDKNNQAFFASFRQAVGDLDGGLLLFVYADLMGSTFKKFDPAGYKSRIQAVEDMISWL